MNIIKRYLIILLIFALCFTVSCKTSSGNSNNTSLKIGTTSFVEEPIAEFDGQKYDFLLNYSNESEMLSDMKLVCENSEYELYYHEKSLVVAVADKKSGKIFFTNPYDAASDSFYAGEVAEELDSQLILTYVDSRGVKKKFHSSTDSVKLGQYKVKLYGNGLRVDYSFGEEREQLICPEVFLKDDYEALVKKMNSDDSERLEYYYTFVNLAKNTDGVAKEYLSKFPFANGKEIYARTDVNSREEKTIDQIFRSVGYDEEQYMSDIEKYGIAIDNNRSVNIKLALEYLLTDDGLRVTVPKDSIAFDSNICYLESVTMLSYFGADSEKSGDSGYLFIPDGSGAIINFANQSDTRRRIMTSRVYGYDKALDLGNYKNDGKQYYLPVFGIVRNNASALFAIIKQGDALSEITARLGAPNSNFYSVYNTFLYTTVESVKRDTKVSNNRSEQQITMHDNNIDVENFVIDYTFLNGSNANYSEMANIYRRHLIENGMKQSEMMLALGIETIGSALYEDSFLGFSYNNEAEFTKYEDNLKMLEYFENNDIDNICLTLNGWQKYGLDSSINKSIKFSTALGGKSSFNRLVEVCKNKNTELYISNEVSGVVYDRTFDGFNRRDNTAKKMDRNYANLSIYDSAISSFTDKGYLTSPSVYTKILNAFSKSAKEYGIKNIDLKALGTQLNSDFNTDRAINRYQTKETLTEYLTRKGEDDRISFDGVNAYVLPYAAQVHSTPMTSSEYAGESASVPFIQLSVGGCVRCFSEPINLSGKEKQMLLGCVAYGMSPFYVLAYNNTELLKMTEYTGYYAINFETLKDSVAEGYKFVSEALQKTQNSRITNHSIISDNVSVSTFENGVKVYVNMNKTDFTVNGITIPAEGYTVF